MTFSTFRFPTTLPDWIVWIGKGWLLLAACYAGLTFVFGVGALLLSTDTETGFAGFLALVFGPFLVLIYGWPGLVLFAVGWTWKKLANKPTVTDLRGSG